MDTVTARLQETVLKKTLIIMAMTWITDLLTKTIQKVLEGVIQLLSVNDCVKQRRDVRRLPTKCLKNIAT